MAVRILLDRDAINKLLYPYRSEDLADIPGQMLLITDKPSQVEIERTCPIDNYNTICHFSCNWRDGDECTYKESKGISI